MTIQEMKSSRNVGIVMHRLQVVRCAIGYSAEDF